MIKIRRNFKKKWRVAIGNQRSSKTKKFIGLRKFTAKRASLQKEASSTKSFRSQNDHAAKLGFCCETSLPLRNHFTATRPPSVKFFAVVKHLLGTHVPFRSYEMSCETLQSQNSQPQVSSAKIFVAAKHPLGTRVPFRSPPTPFRSCEMAYETLCEISHWLRNHHFAAKWASSCENPNCHLNPKLNL